MVRQTASPVSGMVAAMERNGYGGIGAGALVLGFIFVLAGAETNTFTGEMESRPSVFFGLALMGVGNLLVLVWVIATAILLAGREREKPAAAA